MPVSTDKQLARTYWIFALVFAVFLAASLVFMRHMLELNTQESLKYLTDAARHNKVALEKQISGDFYTLKGVATCIGAMDHVDFDQLRPILKAINDENAFIRMGLINPEGRADLVDLNGKVYHDVDLSGQPFFQQAMRGEDVVSGLVPDPITGDSILYSAVPVWHGNAVIGVLCAVNTESVFQHLLSASIFSGAGFSSIVGEGGHYVLPPPPASRSSASAGDAAPGGDVFVHLDEKERVRLEKCLASQENGFFSYYADGRERIAVCEATAVSDWVVVSSVPVDVVKGHTGSLVASATAIIVAALLFFVFLMWRIQNLATRSRKTLEKLAYHDPLTGHANYARFLQDAGEFVDSGRPAPFVVWYCDIKKFKYLNNIWGYQIGDQVLRQLSDLLQRRSGEHAWFCRISADNFVGLCPFDGEEALRRSFLALVAELNERHAAQINGFRLDISMGIYLPESGGEQLSLQDMIDRANIAQKSAKGKSGSQCVFYSEDMRSRVLRETEIESRMAQALADGEFELYLQPKVDIQNGDRVTGAEVLARWRDPGRGLVPPMEFIPLFEKNGFIVQLDRFMFERVCRWLRDYLAEGRPDLNIAVNVSRLGLAQEDFLDFYTGVKRRYGIPDGVLELEFTESMILDDDQAFRRTVLALQENGFLCSLDDFGAGYSSLNILKNLPMDVLKLDILFFRQTVDIRRERIVIANIVAMARALRIRTIAEGVEDMEQVEFLRATGCDVVQGYVFARPMPLPDFDELLRRLGASSIH